MENYTEINAKTIDRWVEGGKASAVVRIKAFPHANDMQKREGLIYG